MCDNCKTDKGDPACPVCKGTEPKCSQCGGVMRSVESIREGRCLWCRPWFKPKHE